MADSQELEVRAKKELVTKEEKTVPARYYVPSTDIYETQDALTVVMEMPGVGKEDITVALENDGFVSKGRLISRNMRGSSRSTPSTTSAIMLAHSRYRTRSIRKRSARRSRMACSLSRCPK